MSDTEPWALDPEGHPTRTFDPGIGNWRALVDYEGHATVDGGYVVYDPLQRAWVGDAVTVPTSKAKGPVVLVQARLNSQMPRDLL
jgi:hypothetical protein